MKRVMAVLAVSTFALWGCASDPHEEARADAEAVDAAAHELAQEAEAYCAAAPWTAGANCGEAQASHHDIVMAKLEFLTHMSERMDRHLHDAGAGEFADVGCGLQAIRAEMSRHAGAACGSDLVAAEAEALGHCALLRDGAAQLHARANAVFHATPHHVTVGGSGSMPGHRHPLPSGGHEWPWADQEPAAHLLCAE